MYDINFQNYFMQNKEEIQTTVSSDLNKKKIITTPHETISNQKTSPVETYKEQSNTFYSKLEGNTTNIYIKKDSYTKTKNNGKTTDTKIEVKNSNIFIFYKSSSSSCKSELEDYDCISTKSITK